MSYISTNLSLLINTVKKAAAGLSRDFSEIEQLQTSVKGHEEFTKAAIERTLGLLRNGLQKARPQYAVVTSGSKLPSGQFFIVSALDGAVNFMHGISHFAVSVAEVVDGKITSAVIYNPATSDLYFTEKGYGAFKEGFRNHERLRVSARKDLNTSLVSAAGEVASKALAVRNFGSIVLDFAFVASGKLEAVVYEGADSIEAAAGILLVKEAGGQVWSLSSKETHDSDEHILSSSGIVATNTAVSDKVFSVTNKY